MKNPDWKDTPGLRFLLEQLVPEASKVLMSEDDYQPVLVTGDTGVGKSHVKNRILEAAKISEGDRIPVNCATFPRELIEAELFGYEDGAFTDARKGGKSGLVDEDKKVLILDEIGSLPQYMQAKLLTFLETGDFRRVGGTTKENSPIRILALTNQDTSKLKFRQDFIYRFFIVNVPALYARRQDVVFLLREWAPKVKWTKWDLLQIMTYNWPGNLRELWLFAQLVKNTQVNRDRYPSKPRGVLYWLRNFRFTAYRHGQAFARESSKLLSRNIGKLPSFFFSQDFQSAVAKYCPNLALADKSGDKEFLLRDLDIKIQRINRKSSEKDPFLEKFLSGIECDLPEEPKSCQEEKTKEPDWELEWATWCELFSQDPLCEEDILSRITSSKEGENLPRYSFFDPDEDVKAWDNWIRLREQLYEELYGKRRSADGGETVFSNATEQPNILKDGPDNLELAFQNLAEKMDPRTYRKRWIDYWNSKGTKPSDIARKFKRSPKTISSMLAKSEKKANTDDFKDKC